VERAIVEAARLVDSAQGGPYSVAGVPVDPDHPDTPARLEGLVYWHWHARAPRPAAEPPSPFPAPIAGVLRAALGAAEFEDGWTVVEVAADGSITATRGEETRWLRRSEYLVPDRLGLLPSPGAAVRASARREQVDDRGYWHTYSPGWEALVDMAPLRLYWNIDPAALPELMAGLTEVLAEAGTPFAAKAPTTPDQLVRADLAVVYVDPDRYDSAVPGLRKVHGAVAEAVRGDPPPLSLPVAPGLGIAEDPGNGESFGQHRSRAVAAAIAGAIGDCETDRNRLVERITAGLAAAGVDLAAPHLVGSPARSYSW
jgi:hypothetical protein